MNTMPKLIVANWKMNPATLTEAVRLARAEDRKNVVICPPFPFLRAVGAALRRAKLGAQDMFWENPPSGGGPYTGEVSGKMLRSLSAHYVIIGHSERRRWLGETDEMVNKKVLAALKAGIKVILCVGESLAIRRRGMAVAKRFVRNQLMKNLKGIRGLWSKTRNLIVTYEPVWAISTSRGAKDQDNADTPDDILQMIRFIKSILASRYALRDMRIIYGGSVNSQNVQNFLQYKDIGGALVGGASLKAKEFKKIIRIVTKLNHHG